MSIVLVLVAFVLFLLAHFVFDEKVKDGFRPEWSGVLATVAVVLTAGLISAKYAPAEDKVGLTIGLTIGAIAGLGGSLLRGKIGPVALGVAAASAIHLLGAPIMSVAQIALFCGVAIGALALRQPGSISVAVVASVCVAADFLGKHHSNTPASIMVGSILGVAGVIGMVLGGVLPNKVTLLRPVILAIVLTLGGVLISWRIGNTDANITIIVVMSALAGLVIDFMLPDGENDATRIALAAIIAVSLATIAFGLAKATGMAVALGTMTLLLLGVGNRLAVLSIGPLFGLVFYRVLKEIDLHSTKALDIGQHYALIGVLLGAVIPLLPTEWATASKLKSGLRSFLWTILILGGPILIAVMLGEKGSIGFVGGLGLAGLCQALRGQRSLLPLAVIPGLAAVTSICLDWFEDWGDLARNDKVKVFMVAGVAFVVVVSILALVSRTPKQEVTA